LNEISLFFKIKIDKFLLAIKPMEILVFSEKVAIKSKKWPSNHFYLKI